ncbi:MAG: hypothetical protein FWD49_01560 [Firmicutes bacterium]|nr:hypothetical protein [Bacillota bacterium]
MRFFWGGCFALVACAVGCTHGYAYPARFGAVTDLYTVMHILPASGQLRIYIRLCISCPLRGSYGFICSS